MRLALHLSYCYYYCNIILFVSFFDVYAIKVLGQECDESVQRCDTHERCNNWEREGECYRNKEYMFEYCPVSCKESWAEEESAVQQAKVDCKDLHPSCPEWARKGECDGADNSMDMKNYCAKTCDTCIKTKSLDSGCVDQHENCHFWAISGECSANSKFMHLNCAASCDTCDKFFVQGLKQTIREKASKRADEMEEMSVGGSKANVGDDRMEVIKWSEHFGEMQEVSGTEWKSTIEQIRKMKKYMETEAIQNLSNDALDSCKNKHKLCSYWSVLDQCNKNKDWMAKKLCSSLQLLPLTVKTQIIVKFVVR